VILGAGFSKAVHEYLPITNQLGQDAVEHSGLASDPRVPRRPFDENYPFEAWLSLLAESQPHLTESENRENAALFSRLKESIAYILDTAQTSAFVAGAPPWFYELLSLLHYRRAATITLNYDLLVEVGVESHRLFGAVSEVEVSTRDILWDQPPLPQTGARLWGEPQDTFRLLKLHGSLDWWSVPEDWTGATLQRAEVRSRFGSPQQMSDNERRRSHPGREPFIIPPSAAKSGSYQNPMVKEIWRTAYEALRQAERISLLGYSLPTADPVMMGMLERVIRSGDQLIDVVNPFPDEIVERLIGLGATQDGVDVTDGPNCVGDFVEKWLHRASTDLTNQLAGFDAMKADNPPLLVAWTNPVQGGSGVRRIRRVGPVQPDGSFEVEMDRRLVLSRSPTATYYGSDGQPTTETLAKLGDIIDRCGQGGSRIVATSADGDRVTLIAAWTEPRDTGASPTWIAFTPAGLQAPPPPLSDTPE
jgi:hypothetical protein